MRRSPSHRKAKPKTTPAKRSTAALLAPAPATAGIASLRLPAWLWPAWPDPMPSLLGARVAAALGSVTLANALAASLLIHAVVLAVRFQPFDLKAMLDRGPPLEVALVNAKTKSKPAKAEILAQANLDGGGNTDANRRARTPLPVPPKEARDNQVSVATKQVEVLEQQAKELLTQLKSTPVPAPVQKPAEASEPAELPTANELMQRTLEAMRLEAQIARDLDAYQKRPKRKFVGSRAEEYRFARYVEDWRLKVERIGNLNYPEAARQLQLYGNLLLTVAIRSDGSLEKVRVDRSSGQRVLDAAAVRIVEMAAPYAPFPPDIRRDTDILEVTRTWTFTRGDELRSD